jgi:SAM-dependent methyltransferase
MNSETSFRERIYGAYVETTSERGLGQMSLENQARQFRRRWQAFLPPDKGAPVLDLGCGCGEFLYFLHREGYTNLNGVDVSPQQVEAARGLGLSGVQLEVGDALDYLQWHAAGFALINAQNLLEHFTRDELFTLLDALVAALLPGGTLLAVVPNAASPFGSRTRYWDITHELSFTPSSLLQVLIAVGLPEVRFLEHGPVVHGVKSAIRFFTWRIIRGLLKVYLLAETAGDRYNIFTQDMRVVARKPG